MRKFAAIMAALLILAGAGLVQAGVVVDEQMVIAQPDGTQVTHSRTVMIQGDKQKSVIDNGSHTVITDLAKGTITMLDTTRKSYVEIPLPPKRGRAPMQGNVPPTISFKKTGAHEKVIGYACDDYTGAGTVGANSVSMTGCYSSSAPGAADYMAFQHKMAEKVKGTAMANLGQIPDGVPLKLAVITIMARIPTAGMSPEQVAKLKQLLANRQFVTHTTVNRITTRTLPSDLFEIPAGYRRRQIPPIFGGNNAAPAAPAGAGGEKVPE